MVYNITIVLLYELWTYSYVYLAFFRLCFNHFFSYVAPKSLYVPAYVIIVQRQNNLISNDIKNE